MGSAARHGSAPLMVLSFIIEGGANVVSEAWWQAFRYSLPRSMARSDCSDAIIPDTSRWATQRHWPLGCIAPKLKLHSWPNCAARASLFEPAREQQSWHDALQELTGAARQAPADRSAA
jgi:hypothetical protein